MRGGRLGKTNPSYAYVRGARQRVTSIGGSVCASTERSSLGSSSAMFASIAGTTTDTRNVTSVSSPAAGTFSPMAAASALREASEPGSWTPPAPRGDNSAASATAFFRSTMVAGPDPAVPGGPALGYTCCQLVARRAQRWIPLWQPTEESGAAEQSPQDGGKFREVARPKNDGATLRCLYCTYIFMYIHLNPRVGVVGRWNRTCDNRSAAGRRGRCRTHTPPAGRCAGGGRRQQ